MQKRIALIGYRGSGKTTLARVLADELSFTYIDTDDAIKAREGTSISTIFHEKGEAYFRDVESLVLDETLMRDAAVIATGGGVILRKKNRMLLQERACVIFLSCDIDETVRRIEEGRDRPRLRKEEATLRDEVVATLTERIPLYRECADYIIDTTSATLDEVLADALLFVNKNA